MEQEDRFVNETEESFEEEPFEVEPVLGDVDDLGAVYGHCAWKIEGDAEPYVERLVKEGIRVVDALIEKPWIRITIEPTDGIKAIRELFDILKDEVGDGVIEISETFSFSKVRGELRVRRMTRIDIFRPGDYMKDEVERFFRD